MTWRSWAIRAPNKKGRAGRSARAYQTHPADVSVWPTRTGPPTQGQGQDFRNHARRVRERAGSGSAGQAGAEVQAQDHTATVVVVTVGGRVPVTVGSAAPPRIVVPGATAQRTGAGPCPWLRVSAGADRNFRPAGNRNGFNYL